MKERVLSQVEATEMFFLRWVTVLHFVKP